MEDSTNVIFLPSLGPGTTGLSQENLSYHFKYLQNDFFAIIVAWY